MHLLDHAHIAVRLNNLRHLLLYFPREKLFLSEVVRFKVRHCGLGKLISIALHYVAASGLLRLHEACCVPG